MVKKKFIFSALTMISTAMANGQFEWFNPTPLVNEFGAPHKEVLNALQTTGRHDFSANKIAADTQNGILKAGFKEYADVTAESVEGFIDDDNLQNAYEAICKVLYTYQDDISPKKFSKKDELVVAIPTTMTGLLAKRLWHIGELIRKGYNIKKVVFITSSHPVSSEFLKDPLYFKKVIQYIHPNSSINFDEEAMKKFVYSYKGDKKPTHQDFAKKYFECAQSLLGFKMDYFVKQKENGEIMRTEDLMLEFAKEHNGENILGSV